MVPGSSRLTETLAASRDEPGLLGGDLQQPEERLGAAEGARHVRKAADARLLHGCAPRGRSFPVEVSTYAFGRGRPSLQPPGGFCTIAGPDLSGCHWYDPERSSAG